MDKNILSHQFIFFTKFKYYYNYYMVNITLAGCFNLEKRK
jgi:hypothetical protein